MAAILLDVDGVLHVSRRADTRCRRRGAPVCGAAGHRLRFVTNSTDDVAPTQLGERLRADGLRRSTTTSSRRPGGVAARVLAGKRVLALTMPGFLDDLDGLELIGMNADAVLVGGADESEEPGRVYSYLNLNRAFLELQAGAELYCLHRNRWWQTRRRARGSTRARSSPGSSTPPGSRRRCSASRAPSTSRRRSRRSTPTPSSPGWSATISRATSPARSAHGMRTVLVRTGKFRPDELEHTSVAARRHRLLGRPARRTGSRRTCERSEQGRRRPDRDRARPAGARTARRRLPAALLHGRRARVLRRRSRTPPSTTPAGSPPRRRSARRSAPASTSPGGRSRSAAARSRGVDPERPDRACAERARRRPRSSSR